MERYVVPAPGRLAAVLDAIMDRAMTVRQLHEKTGASNTSMRNMLRDLLSGDNATYRISGTSSMGRPPRYWLLTEKGRLLWKTIRKIKGDRP